MARYVENTFESNSIFDASGLISQEPSREGRLKYWTNELCAKHPQTFDFAVTVRFRTSLPMHILTLASWAAMEPFFMLAGYFNELCRQFFPLRWALSAFSPNSILADSERL